MVDALSPGTSWDGARGHSYCSAVVILVSYYYTLYFGDNPSLTGQEVETRHL